MSAGVAVARIEGGGGGEDVPPDVGLSVFGFLCCSRFVVLRWSVFARVGGAGGRGCRGEANGVSRGKTTSPDRRWYYHILGSCLIDKEPYLWMYPICNSNHLS